MTREEAIKTLKENYCAMCAYGSQDMDSCDIHSCDNKDTIKALEQEPCEGAISRQAVLDEAFEVDTKEYGRIEVVGDEAEYYSDEEMAELFYDLWEAGIIGIGNLMYKIAED